MLKESQKRRGYECFVAIEPSDEEIKDVQVDLPIDKMPDVTVSHLTEAMVEELFPDVWSERREELQEKSKKDLAAEMFRTGTYLGVKSFLESI